MDKIGIAGNHGERIRSDCRVRVELTRSGGIDLTLDSRVERLFGNSIRELVNRMFRHAGIADAKIVLEDTGALEFILAARMEAALRQLKDGIDPFLLPAATAGVKPGARHRFTRLYLPGNSPRLMINAGIHKPDGIILDLEDSVAADRKAEARILVRNALRSIDFNGAERMVRINQPPAGFDDLDAVVPQGPDMILIPKVEHPEQVGEVDRKAGELISRTDFSRPVLLMPIIESALGVEHAFEIAVASENVAALAVGLEDLTADLGVTRTEEGTESLYARMRIVNACKAAGIQPIDSVYPDVANMEGLAENAAGSRSLGFEGMGCIHPRQIPVIRNAFRPTEEEIGRAKQMILAFEKAAELGLGVVSLGSKMIDPPVVRRAERTVELAVSMGLLKENWRKEDG